MASPPAGAVACVYSHACTAWARNPDYCAISPNWRFLTSRDHPGASAAARRISVSNSHSSKHRDRTRPRSARVALSPLGSSDDHIHLPAAAPGTHKPVAPIENRRVRAVSNSHFSGVRLDLMAAPPAPHDQPPLGFRCIAERWAGLGSHRCDDYRSRSPPGEFFEGSYCGQVPQGPHPFKVLCRNKELVWHDWADKSGQFHS
jgi:hypothetical protein